MILIFPMYNRLARKIPSITTYSVPYRCYTYVCMLYIAIGSIGQLSDLVHYSACSFAVSQASNLALLVGYVA